jgi:hypothetical protein
MQHAGARDLRAEDQLDARLAPPRLRLVEESLPPRAERRTVTITGNPTSTGSPIRAGSPNRASRRRSPAHAQIVARPDRVALWAFLLGLFLVVMAAATAHAAPV